MSHRFKFKIVFTAIIFSISSLTFLMAMPQPAQGTTITSTPSAHKILATPLAWVDSLPLTELSHQIVKTLPTPPPEATTLNRFVLIDQNKQMMYLYEGGFHLRTIPISSGSPADKAFTPPWIGKVGKHWTGGAFQNTNFWGDYMWHLFSGPQGDILIHSVPYEWVEGEKQYDQLDALGQEPVSDGCIRISPEDAIWLQKWNPTGVDIRITRWSNYIGKTVPDSMQ